MIRPAALALALALAPLPALSQDALGEIASGLQVSAPDMLVRAALANCLAWGPESAIEAIAEGGWDSDTDDGGLTSLWLDEALVQVSPTEGWCSVSSPVVSMSEAEAVAEDLLLTAWGGTIEGATDDSGCLVLWSDAAPADSLTLSSDGNDPVCEDQGTGGSAITYFTE